MDPTAKKLRRFRYIRIAVYVFLTFAVLACWSLLGDLETSLEFSSSFATLSQRETNVVASLLYVACGLAAILSGVSAIFDRSKRIVSIILLVVSLALIPATILYGWYIQKTTIPAVLQR